MIKKIIFLCLLSTALATQSADDSKPVVEPNPVPKVDAPIVTPVETPVQPSIPVDRPEFVLPKKTPNDTKPEEPKTSVTASETTVAPKKYLNAQVGDEQWEPEACKCIEDRYLAHYLEKGCTEVKSELFCRTPCPKYFTCPKKEDIGDGCLYKDKIYKSGEIVPVDDPCKKGCYCESKWSSNCTESSITCATVECPYDLRPPEHNPNCFYFYEEGMCCPKRKCLKPQDSQRFLCMYDNKPYRFGQKIYPKEDPCVECTCNHNWMTKSPLSSDSCRKIKCNLQINPHFKAGCLPIYHEKSCCPIDYFCTPSEEQQCKFNNQTYLVGQTVDIKRPKTECKCLVPPELTCIEKNE